MLIIVVEATVTILITLMVVMIFYDYEGALRKGFSNHKKQTKDVLNDFRSLIWKQVKSSGTTKMGKY